MRQLIALSPVAIDNGTLFRRVQVAEQVLVGSGLSLTSCPAWIPLAFSFSKQVGHTEGTANFSCFGPKTTMDVDYC